MFFFYIWHFRLEDYDRNQDFRSQPVIMPENVLVDWPTGGFSQLTESHITNSSLPTVTHPHIEGYFTMRMGIDSRAIGDAQALKKGRLLLESNRVEACSMLHQDKAFFFSGICRAAMKKLVSITTNDYKLHDWVTDVLRLTDSQGHFHSENMFSGNHGRTNYMLWSEPYFRISFSALEPT